MRKLVGSWLIFAFIIFTLFGSFGSSLGKSPKNILLINSYHQGYAWTDSLTFGVVKTLKSYPEVNLFLAYLDAKKFDQLKFEIEKNYILDKYSGISFDGVIVTDNDALDFAFKYQKELFPSLPVVFAGISNPEDYPLENSNFYGYKESFNIDGIVDLVRLLLPESKKLFIITDKTTTGIIIRKKLAEKQKQLRDFTLTFSSDVDEDSIAYLCGKAKAFDAAYYFNVSQDKAGKQVDNEVLFEKIRETGQIPIFSNDLAFWGKGSVGGNYQSGVKQGSEAIKLLLSIMDSTRKETFKRINYTDQGYLFDRKELDRFHISTQKLPDGSLIANQDKLLDRPYFAKLMGLLALLIIAVVILSVVNRRRKIAHRQSKNHVDEIEFQKNELHKAYQKLSEVITELGNTNMKLNESNISLMESKKKAEESDKLKSAFLANVSHEIRTPLNSIVGFSSLLSEPDLDEETRKTYIELVESNTESLLVLIDEIIDLSKIEAQQLSINKQLFSVDTLLSELYQIFIRDHKNSKVELVARKFSETKELVVNSDRVRVKQVFINLLSNALKFTDSGTIEFGYHYAEKEGVVLYVKDSGIGIGKEHHQSIFHRFRKLNENTGKVFRGTGLGLAITQKLVELLGGKIWVESELGEGSAFYFTLEGLVLSDLSKLKPTEAGFEKYAD